MSWWNEAKGMGVIEEVESKREYFVALEDVKTDPFEEEGEMNVDDLQYYADLPASDAKARGLRRLALVSQKESIERESAEPPLPSDAKPQHLYPGMRVWFDGREDELGPSAINVHWELVQLA